MSVAVKTTKKYKTTDVHVKRIDAQINRSTFGAICSCNHLTPETEAKMENLLVPGSAVVPKIAETIERNSPGFEPAMPVLTMPVEVEEQQEQEPPPEAYEYDRARASR